MTPPTGHSHRVFVYDGAGNSSAYLPCADPSCDGVSLAVYAPVAKELDDLRAKVSALAAEQEAASERLNMDYVGEVDIIDINLQFAHRLREILGGGA